MPRPAKGARLWFRPERRDSTGRVTHRGQWVILDGRRQLGTGLGRADGEGAEKELARYIEGKYTPVRPGERDPARIPVADVLTFYMRDKVPGHIRPHEAGQRIATLLDFWCEPDTVARHMTTPGRYDAMLADVRGETCRAYVRWRTAQVWKSARPKKTRRRPRPVTEAAARRELEELRAAINHFHEEGHALYAPQVALPGRAPARERWLARDEAAALLWACWRARDPLTGTSRRRHIARFILVALYTGSRAGVVCAAGFAPGAGAAWVDLERGILYRRGQGERETKKRRTPAALPGRLLAHLRRWKRKEIARAHVVEYAGKPVASVRNGFAAAVAEAGLGPEVTPHTLRHTAATWAMQNGADLWDAAGWLGMSVEMLDTRYGHHHPRRHRGVAEAVARRPAQATAVVSQ